MAQHFLEPGDGVNFAWNLEREDDSVVLYAQRPGLRGSFVQVYMSPRQFLDMCDRASELRRQLKNDDPAETTGPPVMAGRES